MWFTHASVDLFMPCSPLHSHSIAERSNFRPACWNMEFPPACAQHSQPWAPQERSAKEQDSTLRTADTRSPVGTQRPLVTQSNRNRNDERRTTNDERRTTNDQRPTTNDQRPTTNDQRPTTNDQRPTTNDQRRCHQRHPTTNKITVTN